MSEPTPQLILPTPRQNGPVLHFIREAPGWCSVGFMLLVFLAAYIATGDAFLQRMLDLFAGGFLTATMYEIQKAVKKTPDIKADTIQTDSVNTETMADATITTGTVTMEKKDK